MTTRITKSIVRFLTVTLHTSVAAALLGLSAMAADAPDEAAARGAKAADQVTAGAAQRAEDLASPVEPAELKSTAAQTKAARKSREKTDHEKLIELIGISLGFVATVMGLGVAFLAIWCDYKKRRDLVAACHEERVAALEKGLELPPFPPELMSCDTSAKASVPRSGLMSGLMWLAVGIGLAMFLSPNNRGFFHPSVGAIPGAIGIAYLIYYLLEGRKRVPSKNGLKT